MDVFGFTVTRDSDTLKPGEFFLLEHHNGANLAVLIVEQDQHGVVLLNGPDGGDPLPGFVSASALPGHVQVFGDKVAVRPSGDPTAWKISFPVYERRLGSLVLDSDGGVGVVVAGSRGGVIRRIDGGNQLLKSTRAFFTEWSLWLQRGGELVQLAQFAGTG